MPPPEGLEPGPPRPAASTASREHGLLAGILEGWIGIAGCKGGLWMAEALRGARAGYRHSLWSSWMAGIHSSKVDRRRARADALAVGRDLALAGTPALQFI